MDSPQVELERFDIGHDDFITSIKKLKYKKIKPESLTKFCIGFAILFFVIIAITCIGYSFENNIPFEEQEIYDSPTRILVGDINENNCVFKLFEIFSGNKPQREIYSNSLQSWNYNSFEDMLNNFINSLPSYLRKNQINFALFGGPTITNGIPHLIGWTTTNKQKIQSQFNIKNVGFCSYLLVNSESLIISLSDDGDKAIVEINNKIKLESPWA